MSRWPTSPLGEVCTINPRFDPGTTSPPDYVTFVPMAAVDEVAGTVARPELRAFNSVAKGYTPFMDGDVLFAKITPCMENGKAAIARNLSGGVGFGSTEFHVIRHGPTVRPEWVFGLVRQASFRAAAKARFTGTAGQQRVPADFLKRFPIPVPSLEEQDYLMKLVAEAEALRRLREDADKRTEALIPALFNEMFGDSGSNQCGWPVRRLGEVVDFAGGGTPSRARPELWTGRTPWVSPKDMKPEEITGAEEHVGKAAFDASNLRLIPTGTVLIVVRGMILAHTVPIRVCRVPVAINQDMKALIPQEPVSPEYLRWALQAQHSLLLQRISTAGHGTKKLDTDRLRELQLVFPPIAIQEEFSRRVADIRALVADQASSRKQVEVLYQAVLHGAFAGGL